MDMRKIRKPLLQQMNTLAGNSHNYTRYARGYGYGDVVSINTGSGFSDSIPSGSSATWVYTLEFDDA